jgi:hypothetical protein
LPKSGRLPGLIERAAPGDVIELYDGRRRPGEQTIRAFLVIAAPHTEVTVNAQV